MSQFSDSFEALQSTVGGSARFAETLDKDLVEQAMTATGKVTVRRRLLPPEVTVWVLVGAALYRNQSLRQVAATLQLCLNGTPAASSLCVAKARVGSEPIQWLFQKLGSGWSDEFPQFRWRNFKLLGIDGTKMDIADTDANHQFFGRPGSSRGVISSYPQARVVALMDLSLRMIVSATVGPLSEGETSAAQILFNSISNDSICFVDRGFQSFRNFCALSNAEENRHFVARIKSDFRVRWLKNLDQGSYLGSISPSSQEDKKDTELPKELQVRVIEYEIKGHRTKYRIITSLLDSEKFSSADLAQMYHVRWEIELGFRDLKVTMLQREEALRSQSPDGVKQEIWSLLLAYNLVRREMALTAVENGTNPVRLSFKSALLAVHAFFMMQSSPLASPGKLPQAIRELREALMSFRLPPRRPERVYPRAVKKKMSKFRRNPGRLAKIRAIA